MKKLLIVCICFFGFLSCKETTKTQKTNPVEKETIATQQNDGLIFLKGEFVYYDDAAVLQTSTSIYGVLLNDKCKELNNEAKKYKSESTGMVQVEIRGKVIEDEHEKILWDNKLEIVEILSIKPISKKDNNTIKLGS